MNQPSGGGYDISGAISNALSQFLSAQFSATDNSVNANGSATLDNSGQNVWPMVLIALGSLFAIVASIKIFGGK